MGGSGRRRWGWGPLAAKALRDLIRFRWQALGLALLVAVVVANTGGRARARASILETRRSVYERLHFADLEIRCLPTEPARLLRGVEEARPFGIERAEVRLLAWGTVRPAGERPIPAVIRLLPDAGAPYLHGLEIVEGRWPEVDEAAVVVDRSLRDLNGVTLGQEISVGVGRASRRLPVVGVSLSPEILIVPTHPRYVLPLRGTLAVIGVSRAAASDIEEADDVTSVLLSLAPDADVDAIVRAISEDSRVHVTHVIPAAEQPGKMLTDVAITNFDVYTPPVMFVLSFVGLLLMLITVTRLVRRQREQVGVLLAQGYERWAVTLSFCVLPVTAAVVGAFLGILAHGVYADVLATGITRFAGLPPLANVATPGELWVGAATSVVAATVAGFVVALGITGLMPADALRAAARPLRARPSFGLAFASRLGDLFRLPLSARLGLAQVLRRHGETVGAVIGLGAAFAVLLAFLMVHLAHRREVWHVLETWTRDSTVHFRDPVGPETLSRVATAAQGEAEPFVSRPVLVRREGTLVQRRVVGLETSGLAAGLPLAEGRALGDGPFREVLIDHWLALQDGMRVGERIVLFPYPDSPEGMEAEIVGVVDGISFGRIVVPLPMARALYELGETATAAHVSSSRPDVELEAALWAVPGVETVFGTRRIAHDLSEAWEARAWVIRLAIGGAAFVALIFLALLAALDAADRAPELAVLSSLGWRSRSVFVLLATEVFVRGVLAVALAALLGPLLAEWITTRMAAANGYRIDPAAPPWLLAAVLGPALLIVPLGALPAWRTARKLAPTRLLRLLCQE